MKKKRKKFIDADEIDLAAHNKASSPGFRLFNYDDWKWTYRMDTHRLDTSTRTPVEVPVPKFKIGDKVCFAGAYPDIRVNDTYEITGIDISIGLIARNVYYDIRDKEGPVVRKRVAEGLLMRASEPPKKQRSHGTLWELPDTDEVFAFFVATTSYGTRLEKWFQWFEGVKGGYPGREVAPTVSFAMFSPDKLRYKKTLIGHPRVFYTQFEMNNPGWEEVI